MKIVIAGGGKVGELLCSELGNHHNDIVLIEKDPNVLEYMINNYDITGLAGNAASYEIQLEAGVEDADVFIATSETDEINIISAIIARKIGAQYTAARVRNPEYATQFDFVRDSLGIDLFINPDFSAARDIAAIIKYPSSLSVETFMGGRINLVEFEISPRSSLVGLPLRDYKAKFGSVRVCIIHRGDDIMIPQANSRLQVGDRVHVIGLIKDMAKFRQCLLDQERQNKSVMIVGGGRITHYLLKLLSKDRVDTKVIEVDMERCEFLSAAWPNATIVHGDGTDPTLLDDEGMTDYDAFVSLTGIDEENLITSVYAKHAGVKKVITKMNRTKILKILDDVKIKSIITPKQLIANDIVRFVRSRANAQGSNVEALYRLADNQVEALQFRVHRDSHVCGIPLQELNLRKDLLIVNIVRDQELVFPNGTTILQPHDRVILVTTDKQLTDINDILEA
ncbi:Trk system potassium transporter TrkA [Streptococcus merionis]|uniref:Trk system potassium uptake protein TrkA n=1 Tax=Streptococcus merionis TaxID=400065 RepID=A0A239SQ97_9STRE|nr:Trk system potassium transporter TrkA [Streptococcus merionis]SNU86914.1 potassium transporter peripheral membrane protein [Streptococcus merionis]